MSETVHTVQTNTPLPHTAATGPVGRQYEGFDIRLGPVVIFALVLVLLTLLVLLMMRGLFGYFAAQHAAHDPLPTPLAHTRSQQPPEPRLQVTPAQEILQLRASEEAILQQYGWVNAAEGIVRIPLERALDLLVERGLPTRPSASPAPAQGSRP